MIGKYSVGEGVAVRGGRQGVVAVQVGRGVRVGVMVGVSVGVGVHDGV
jgi:hypothetical protein